MKITEEKESEFEHCVILIDQFYLYYSQFPFPLLFYALIVLPPPPLFVDILFKVVLINFYQIILTLFYSTPI